MCHFWPLPLQLKPPSCLFGPLQDPLFNSHFLNSFSNNPESEFLKHDWIMSALCVVLQWLQAALGLKSTLHALAYRPSIIWLLSTLYLPIPILPLSQITPTKPNTSLNLKWAKFISASESLSLELSCSVSSMPMPGGLPQTWVSIVTSSEKLSLTSTAIASCPPSSLRHITVLFSLQHFLLSIITLT